MIGIREFKKEDLDNGYIETISEIWPCDGITEETLEKVLDKNYILSFSFVRKYY